MIRRRSYITVAAAVSVFALVGVTQEAKAGALGFATTQISDFTISNGGGVLTFPGSLAVVSGVSNTESASSTLNGITVSSSVLATQPAINQVCQGNCAVFTPPGAQSFSLVTPTLALGTTPFAQAATNLGPLAVVSLGGGPAGANSNTAAQTQLIGANTGQGNAANGNTAGFTLTLTGSGTENITGTFNALTQINAQTDKTGSSGLASTDFEILITDTTGAITYFDWKPNGTGGGASGTGLVSVADQGVNLNTQRSANFPNLSLSYMASNPGGLANTTAADFLSFTASLPEGVPLDFSITQTNLAQATSVPEPMTLALFGTGLLGLGVISRKRRRRA